MFVKGAISVGAALVAIGTGIGPVSAQKRQLINGEFFGNYVCGDKTILVKLTAGYFNGYDGEPGPNTGTIRFGLKQTHGSLPMSNPVTITNIGPNKFRVSPVIKRQGEPHAPEFEVMRNEDGQDKLVGLTMDERCSSVQMTEMEEYRFKTPITPESFGRSLAALGGRLQTTPEGCREVQVDDVRGTPITRTECKPAR